ncbi:MAG TPA: HAD family hydrolase [Rhizobacter sp.]|nr:HAD family hydrolase [Rhizobacter sp.]
MPRPVIALDADGVLLDFNLAYAHVWGRAFGKRPHERDPRAYWPTDRWHVPELAPAQWEHFRTHFDQGFWSAVPAIEGAVSACHRLHKAGFDLVCVTALDLRYEAARLNNLRALGFPIERVLATGNSGTERSPKADAVNELRPVAFVDDYLPYLRGVHAAIHTALILREPHGSPNAGSEMSLAKSMHADLAAFSHHWLAG